MLKSSCPPDAQKINKRAQRALEHSPETEGF